MITRDTIIGNVLKENEGAYEILTSFGMHCLGCPSSQMESLSDACAVHGISSEALLTAINEKLSK